LVSAMLLAAGEAGAGTLVAILAAVLMAVLTVVLTTVMVAAVLMAGLAAVLVAAVLLMALALAVTSEEEEGTLVLWSRATNGAVSSAVTGVTTGPNCSFCTCVACVASASTVSI
jgi:hypothetical protein